MTDQDTSRQDLAKAWAAVADLDLSLPEKLSAYQAASRTIIPDVLAAYDRMVMRCAANDAEHAAPAVGDVMPDFLFQDPHGRFVSFAPALERGPLVISFNRGHWCPYCRLELAELRRAYDAITAVGASIVSIVPETGQFSQQMIDANNLPFPVFTDLDLSYALSLGLVVSAGGELKDVYERRGIDLPRFQSNGGWLLPIPATFVIGQDGRVVARAIDTDFRRRMPIEAILAALKPSSSI